MLKWFTAELGIKITFEKASDYNFEGTKSDLVLDMCKKLGAKTYIFGSLGKEYVNEKDFENAGIKIIFQNYQHPSYTQLHGKFISHLSILDLLFNCGPDSLDKILHNNTSKQEILEL